MLKKITMLALAVGALVAFAAPATASASLFWETAEDPLGSTTASGDTVVFHGTLSWTTAGLKHSCNVTSNIRLWNDPIAGAHGEVTSLTFSPDPEGAQGCTVAVNLGAEIYVDVTACHSLRSASGLPWTIRIGESMGGSHHVTIDDFAYTTEFAGSGCPQHLGIPSGTKLSDTDDMTGEVEGHCIGFTNAGMMGNTMEGELCATQTDLRLTTEE